MNSLSAMSTYRVARWLRIRGAGPLASVMDAATYLIFGCVIPSHCSVGRGTTTEHRGVSVVINREAVIGERCKIGAQVVIGGKGKGVAGAPTVGNDVYLGVGSKILGAVKIGDGAVIGANSVVLADVPAGATAVGIPARVLPARNGAE